MNDEYEKELGRALEILSKESVSEERLHGVERAVWTEIAIRKEESTTRWFGCGRQMSPLRIATVCGLFAMFIGAMTGLSQAANYKKQVAASMEQRYVATIHPVMHAFAEIDEHNH